MQKEPEKVDAHETEAFESYLMGFTLPELPAGAADTILAPAREEAARSCLWGRMKGFLGLLFQPAWAFSMAAILLLLNLAIDELPSRIVGRPAADPSAQRRRARAAHELEEETGLEQRYILARIGPYPPPPSMPRRAQRIPFRQTLEGPTGS